jgi:hypothetical protein
MTITGKLTWIEQGSGTWAVTSEDGLTYELYGPKAEELIAAGQRAAVQGLEDVQCTVTGTLREDVMTMAMIGPVLEVESFSAG